MRVHLRADSANGMHTRFTFFMNGGNCGQLCMREDEALHFHHLVMMSTWAKRGEIVSSGHWTKEEDEKAD